ncbi:MAG TPA: copper amine oxidase N-terminal domain-containing protein [Sedimentibacter sp.]|nr:copper amine oxidase N-terminal domain-containing protein [Sedimentibacter sp.]
MNKKFCMLVIGITIIISLLVGGNVFAENNITVQLDGKMLNFDVQPQLIGGRTMVPLRMIFESMGATVDWNNDTQTVIAFNEHYYVQATINDTNMKVNGENRILDIPPLLVDGRTLVPARFVAEAFGAEVEWDAKTSTVYIHNESKVPQNFTDGYEKAVFSKFNSFASENGLGGTEVYIDCIIDRTSIIDTDEGKIIVGYLIDNDNNNWIALLNGTVFVNEKEYNSVIGKPLVFCGIYDGYSATEKMPYVYLDELCVKETGEIKSGIGKLMSIAENNKIETEVNPKENTIIYDLTTASGIEDYLTENYSSVETAMGTFKFQISVDTPYFRDDFYDYDITFKGDFYQFSEISYLIATTYTEEQQEETKQQLKDFMKIVAKDLISNVKNKKLEGCYYISRYKYPNLKDIIPVTENLELESYCNWTNYDWKNDSNDASASTFRWRTSLDKEIW